MTPMWLLIKKKMGGGGGGGGGERGVCEDVFYIKPSYSIGGFN